MYGGLERQSRTRFALPVRHHEPMSYPTLSSTELVYVCTVQVLFPSKRVGIAPPPHLFFCIGGPACDWDCVLSMHVAGHPEESITLLRLIVMASSRLLLNLERAGLMPMLSMLSPLSTERPCFFFFSFFFHLTYSRWTSSLPSCLWSQRIFPSLPGSRLTIIFYHDSTSALLQFVNQWLNFYDVI